MSDYLKQIRDNLKAHHKLFGNGIPLIASENVTSPQCREVCNSDFSHRYAEGIAGQRVYAGCEYIDNVEKLATELAQKYYDCSFADVRPISGVVANLAAYTAFSDPGDKMCCMPIPSGGHISHAPKMGRKSGRFIGGTAGAVHGLDIHYLKFDWEEMNLDIDKSAQVIRETKPKILLFGGSVFLFPHPVKELAAVAKENPGTTVLYDGAHVLGLIGSGYFQDPLKEGADVLMGSTHKTLPGPQHGILLSNGPDESNERLNKACFPSMLSNHHLHNVAGLAVTLAEMLEYGKAYHGQVIKNAKALAENLHKYGFNVLCENKGFTESHQVVADITNFEKSVGLGGDIERLLEKAGIIINRNLLPWDISRDHRNYKNPGGIRLGTSELTRIGMKESEMQVIAEYMKKIVVDKVDPVKIKKDILEFRKDYQKVQYAFPAETDGYEYISFP
jgi:glycine hydroxymethyltransferase